MLQHIVVPTLPVPLVGNCSRPSGLVAGTLIRTEAGELPVEYLLAGDMIETVNNGLVELRGTSLAEARDIDVVRFSRPDGDLIVIAFPDRAALDAWYASDAYRRILPLRTENSAGDVVFVDGVGTSHRALDVLSPPNTGAD